jgi:hypothetical protein
MNSHINQLDIKWNNLEASLCSKWNCACYVSSVISLKLNTLPPQSLAFTATSSYWLTEPSFTRGTRRRHQQPLNRSQARFGNVPDHYSEPFFTKMTIDVAELVAGEVGVTVWHQ